MVTDQLESSRKVLESAAAISADLGVEAISIKRLTAESGVSNGSIYHHFGSRDGVIAALVTDVLAGYQDGARLVLDNHPDDARGGIEGLVTHHLEWVESHPDQAGLLLFQRNKVAAGPYGDRLAIQNREFFRRVRSWMEDQARAGRMPETDFELSHALVLAPAQDVCAGWLLGRIKTEPTAFTARLAPAAWAAISADAKGKG